MEIAHFVQLNKHRNRLIQFKMRQHAYMSNEHHLHLERKVVYILQLHSTK